MMTSSAPERFRPLLAASLDGPDALDRLAGSKLIISPKVDGIRVLCHPTLGPVTRSLKPVPNDFIRSILSNPRLHGLDGEVIVGELAHPNQFNETTSGVMTRTGKPDFRYYAFDQFYDPGNQSWELNIAYEARQRRMEYRVYNYETESDENAGFSRVHQLESEAINENPIGIVSAELDIWEENYLSRGFEGLMIRKASGKYKLGRSTLKEGILVKVKRFEDCEAEVIGYEELLRNKNVPTRNVLGYTERSDHQAGKEGAGTLGALVVHANPWGRFNIGSGFDAATRDKLWAEKVMLIGRKVKFKHQKVGQVDKPRFPIFLGFRGDE